MELTQVEKQARMAPRGAGLVVIVPAGLENLTEFARKIYYLASSQRKDVIYLALDQGNSDGLASARQLATLTALTQDQAVRASALQVDSDDWIEVLRQVTREGDVVIWTDALLAAPAGLAAELGISQQVLPWLAAPVARGQGWLRVALVWLAALAILGVFIYLEFGLAGLVLSGALKKVALVVLFALELGIFYQWDRMAR